MVVIKGDMSNNTEQDIGGTINPAENNKEDVVKEYQTPDIHTIQDQYKEEALKGDGCIDTGVGIPKDMRVKLVRADSAILEIVISILYSVGLTISGIFIGVWGMNETHTFLEKVGIGFTGVITLVLIAIFVFVKVIQLRSSVFVPNEFLEDYNKREK